MNKQTAVEKVCIVEVSGAKIESKTLRNKILSATDPLLERKIKHYISENGNDNNDGLSPETALKSFSAFTKEGKPVPFDEINPTTWPGVMRKTYETLKRLYPNSVIFFCSPIQGNEISRPYYQMLYKRNLMSSICDRISDVEFIDTFNCGICNAFEKRGECGRDLIDGLHPNVNGAKKIGLFNARAVKAYFI